MPSPLVSVIVPLYNYENYIADCIQSIINQTYDNWELIIIDDCSTDASYNAAKKFETDNIKVIKLGKNSGYSTAKNEGIIESRGDFITCLDADDMMTKKSISKRMGAMLKHNVQLVHANAISIFGNTSLVECYKIDSSNPKLKRMKPRVHAQTVITDRRVHIKYGLYDERLRSKADKEMWTRLLGNKGANLPLIQTMKIKDDVAYYRRHNASMMSMRRKNRKYDKMVTALFSEIITQRRTEGITTDNTRFLEK